MIIGPLTPPRGEKGAEAVRAGRASSVGRAMVRSLPLLESVAVTKMV